MSYYSGWDARRVASKLVSEYLAGDDENRGEGEERQNRDNGNAEGSSNVADEQTPISANDGHDDIDLQAGDARDITGTNNASFYEVDGRNVPVSADTHYLHRDKRLKAYSSEEFSRNYYIRKVASPSEIKWHRWATGKRPDNSNVPGDSNETATGPLRPNELQPQYDPHCNQNVGREQEPREEDIAAPTQQRQRGRPTNRHLLEDPHPLRMTHYIAEKQKVAVNAHKGAPMPTMPGPLEEADDDNPKWRNFLKYFVSTSIPYSPEEPPVCGNDTWLSVWKRHLLALEHDACLHRAREPDITSEMSLSERILNETKRDIRLVASGRLYELENKINGFKTTQNADDTTKAYRTRSKTLWNNRNKPTQSRYSRQENQEYQQALRIIADADIRGNDPCCIATKRKAEGILAKRSQLTALVPSKLLGDDYTITILVHAMS
jgi:hypothetical protein